MKTDEFFLLAQKLEAMSGENVASMADGILQEYEANYLACTDQEDRQRRMAEALKKFASGVMTAEDSYQ